MRLFFYLKKFKKGKLSEYTPMILITVLLICQIIVSYYLSYSQNIKNHFTRVSQVMQVMQASEDNQRNVAATLAASILSDPEVLVLAKNFDGTQSAFEISKKLRKYLVTADSIENIYLYNQNNSFLCDANSNKSYNGTVSPSHEIVFDCIRQYAETGKTDFYYTSSSSSNSNIRYFYKIYLSPYNSSDLIITKENFTEFSRAYLDISWDMQGEVIMARPDGEIIFGDTNFNFFSYLNENEIYKLKHNNSIYNNVSYNNKEYVAVYTYSASSDRYYVVLTPESIIVRDGFSNKNFIYTYICIFLSLLTLARVFSLWKKFRVKLLYSHSKPPVAEPEIKLHSYLTENSDQSIAMLLSLINKKYPNAQLATVLLIKIDNAEKLKESYSPSDYDLIKYGVNNICTEIFTNHGVGVLNLTDTEDVFEYIIVTDSSEFFERECINSAKECMSSLSRYISMDTSYFIGSPLPVKDIHQSYENALQIFEYSFIRGANSVLLTKDLRSVSPEDFLEAKRLCDVIKLNIIESSSEYADNLASLKSLTENMNPSQIREILYNLIISMYSAVEHLEHKLNILVIFDVSNCFAALDNAQFSKEIFDIADALYGEVAAQLSDRDKIRNSHLVSECMKIINESYGDKNLCVEEIAQRLGFSANYLGRKFKQLTGSSIATVITEIRLDVAASEIISTNDKIQDIIKRVGITNNSHFTVLFRKRFGESPINYRHTHKKDKKKDVPQE